MRKIKFSWSSKFAGCDDEEIMEYPDDVSEEDIEADFLDWVAEQGSASWEDTFDDE